MKLPEMTARVKGPKVTARGVAAARTMVELRASWHGVEKLLLRSEDAARINSGDRHSLRIVLELRGKDTGEPCIIFLLRYNQMSPISRRVLNGK